MLQFFCLQSCLASSNTSSPQQVDLRDQPMMKELHSPIKGEFITRLLLSFTHPEWSSVRIVRNASSCCYLKTLDTIGNCQRPVVLFGVSYICIKITNLWKFEHNWLSKLRDKNGKKTKNTLVTQSCMLSDTWFRDLKL